MKCSIILLLFVLMSQIAISQQRDPSVILYDKGNAAVARKDYRTADSLFTLSLNLAPHPDSYYNRAVCRRQLNDFKGYCLDLNEAADMGDKESYNLYWRQCAKKDTIYKKNAIDTANKEDYEIVEYITTYKYNTNFEYIKCDTANSPILSKIRRDNEIIYKNCKDVEGAKYIGGGDSLITFIKTHTDFSERVQQKKLIGATNFIVETDEKGKVKEVKNINNDEDEAITELIKGLLITPNWNPAFYGTKLVKFQTNISVCYYDSELIISSSSFFNKDSSIVEIMPEFPGGVRELLMFIQRNIIYPLSAKEAGLQGRCFLKFVVLPNGKIANIKVIRGVAKCPQCDMEAVKVVQAMPKWKPGTQNGKPVPVFFNLPINFHLR